MPDMTEPTVTVEIKHRWTGSVIFSASVAGITVGVRLGAAVKIALEVGANLRDADLRYAGLRYADLSGADLRGANLRGAKLSGAGLRYADLRYADLSGADLSGANLSGAGLRGAGLRYADLSGADLSGANLRGAKLSGADLSGANLRYADLRDADLRYAGLRYADLSGADLSGADLRGADLSDAPTVPNIHQAVYAAASQPGALDMGAWHVCDTTHCRAGWVVTLAGEAGAELEAKIGTPAAAAAIYLASDPERFKRERLPNFYADNATALADMKRCADEEAA
jgi:hypothetical protein